MSEDNLLRAVMELARLLRYRICHFRPARTAQGWRTAIMGDPGWPDLAIAGHARCLLVELKADAGVVTEDQQSWLVALREAGIEAYVWRPREWENGEIRRILEGAQGLRESTKEGLNASRDTRSVSDRGNRDSVRQRGKIS